MIKALIGISNLLSHTPSESNLQLIDRNPRMKYKVLLNGM